MEPYKLSFWNIAKFSIIENNWHILHSYIASGMDYFNGILHGLPSTFITKLQDILNTASSLVTKPRKYEHITPVMINLHWLPIQYRI